MKVFIPLNAHLKENYFSDPLLVLYSTGLQSLPLICFSKSYSPINLFLFLLKALSMKPS